MTAAEYPHCTCTDMVGDTLKQVCGSLELTRQRILWPRSVKKASHFGPMAPNVSSLIIIKGNFPVFLLFPPHYSSKGGREGRREGLRP